MYILRMRFTIKKIKKTQECNLYVLLLGFGVPWVLWGYIQSVLPFTLLDYIIMVKKIPDGNKLLNF